MNTEYIYNFVSQVWKDVYVIFILLLFVYPLASLLADYSSHGHSRIHLKRPENISALLRYLLLWYTGRNFHLTRHIRQQMDEW